MYDISIELKIIIALMSIILPLITIIVCFHFMFRIVEDLFLKSLDGISDWMKLSPTVTGATLMAFGTSAPELCTSIVTLFVPGTDSAIGLGAIVGAALFQTLVVIGISSILHASKLDWKPILRDSVFYLISIILLVIFSNDGKYTSIEALLLLFTYAFFIITQIFWSKYIHETGHRDSLDIVEEEIVKMEKKEKGVLSKIHAFITKPIDTSIQIIINIIPDPNKNAHWIVPVFILSLGMIGFISYLLVKSAESLASALHIPNAIIALTILAAGGSLPEVISSAIVAKQKRGEMAISNALGSNIFNILMGLALPLFIYTLSNGTLQGIANANIHTSILLLFATLFSVLLLLIIQKFKVTRWSGTLLIVMYAVYVFAAYSGWI